MVKKNLKIIVYILIVVCIYLSIPLIAVTPTAMIRAFRGPDEKEKKVLTFVIKSEFQRTPNNIRVLLPDNMKAGEKYSVLYILPTSSRLLDPWWNNGIMEAVKHDVANRYNIICVAPTFSDMPWYADHPSNKKIWQESYFFKSVIPYIEKNFAAIKSGQGRFLIGFSKSGTGAFSLMLRHPQMFAKTLSFDAPMLFEFVNVWGSKLQKIFGTKENFRKYQIPILMKDHSYMFRGKNPKFILMGYSDNQQAIEDVHLLMEHFKIPHVYDNSVEYRHNWQSGWFDIGIEYLLGGGIEGLSFYKTS